MKRYTLFSLVGLLAVAGVVFAQQNEPPKNISNEQSVEFNIAELSPGGETVGYAMPASGGSPPTTEPGCAIAVNPQFAENGQKIAISWLHGIIPGSGTGRTSPYLDSMSRAINGTSFNFAPEPEKGIEDLSPGDTDTAQDYGILNRIVAMAGGGQKTPPADPVAPDLRGVLEGLSPWRVSQACIAICNKDRYNCNPNNPDQWQMLQFNGKNATVASADFDQTTDGLLTFAAPNLVEASGGASACNNAQNVSKTSIFNPAGLSGNYVIGIKSTYVASYGGHHSVSKENTCSANVSINTDQTADLEPEILIADQTFTASEDLPLSVLIQNTGSGATDHKVAEDGKFNYRISLDVNNNGFTNGQGGDRLFNSGGNTVGPLAKQFHLSKPFYEVVEPVWQAADVSPGTHGLRVCVDTQNKVTEIREDNNCATATFKVALPDIAAGAFSGLKFEYGKILYLPGYAENTSSQAVTLPITTTFQNQIEIRGGGKTLIDPANAVNSLSVAGTEYVVGSGIDPEVEFPDLRNLEYRVVVDVNDDVREDSEANNASPWMPFTLVDEEIVTVSDFQCSNLDSSGNPIDDDGDGWANKMDPGCWTNPEDIRTYNPFDSSEDGGFLEPTLTVTPSLVRAGDPVTITWNNRGRHEGMCTLSNNILSADEFDSDTMSADASGTVVDRPQNMTKYSIECSDNQSAEAWVRVLPSVMEN